MKNNKYCQFPSINLPDRIWPSRTLTRAPIWCSVDLRDGNQALATPMDVSQKLKMFRMLVECGFKEIEIGFPSASNTEFAFNRELIEGGFIPDDVTIQVLVQAREELIERTFDSLVGAKRAIVHLYNSTSPAQRRVVFGMNKRQIIEVAVRGAQWIKDRLSSLEGTEVRLQYSPESFSATEVEFSKEVSEAVMDVWQPTAERKMILNLPNTVEVAMPTVYADQIEWMCRNIRNRESLIVSVHTHNDRGTGVAATEMGLLAGADRVEGTLFGNGERTGNLDIVTVAMNLYSQGIESGLDFSNINKVREVYETCTGMTVSARHPYAGELVFTAFSGSHQDAIKKGFAEWEKGIREKWDVPYLAIDPVDIGREYSEVVRVNGQSGKGGIAYLLETEFGIELPKDMQREFSQVASDKIDSLHREVTAGELKSMLWQEYVEREKPYSLKHFHASGNGDIYCEVMVLVSGEEKKIIGNGNGPIAAFVDAIRKSELLNLEVVDFKEQSLESGSGAKAIAYVRIVFENGKYFWGAGVDTNSELASIKAVLNAINRFLS